MFDRFVPFSRPLWLHGSGTGGESGGGEGAGALKLRLPMQPLKSKGNSLKYWRSLHVQTSIQAEISAGPRKSKKKKTQPFRPRNAILTLYTKRWKWLIFQRPQSGLYVRTEEFPVSGKRFFFLFSPFKGARPNSTSIIYQCKNSSNFLKCYVL